MQILLRNNRSEFNANWELIASKQDNFSMEWNQSTRCQSYFQRHTDGAERYLILFFN